MFNFYVVLANHDKLNDAGRPTTQIESPIIINKKNKKRRIYRKHRFSGEINLKISDEKKTETLFSTFQKNPMEQKDPERVNWTKPS